MLLHEKLKRYRLILASQSPRRRQLLSDAGLEHTLAERFECEEIYPADLPAAEVAEYLSRLKSDAYPATLEARDILLTADTVVVAGGAANPPTAMRRWICCVGCRGASTRL